MKAKYKKLFSKIKNLKLQELFCVNAGGCGCFAMMMIEIFKSIEIDPPEIIYCNPNRYAPNHVMLTDGKYCYDSEGVYKKEVIESRYSVLETETEENLQKDIDMEGHWNDRFDRRDLDKIKGLVVEAIAA